MPDRKSDLGEPSQARQRALSRWDNEGGAILDDAQNPSKDGGGIAETPGLTGTELVQLRIRVIALENLMVALLTEASDRELDLVREMASYISPRPGFSEHPLTVRAAAQMVNLVERAEHFRSAAAVPYKRSPVFDEKTLPGGLRQEHRTKPGVWGLIRVLNGRVRYQVLDPASEAILEPGHPGLVLPDQPHLVEPLGSMRMQIEFYDRLPDPSFPGGTAAEPRSPN